MRYAQTVNIGESVWVTSESGPGSLTSNDDDDELNNRGGCHVSARNVTNGNVIWRVDACSSPNGRHATLVVGEMVHTLDDFGILKGWKINEGMQWDADVIDSAGNYGYDVQPPRLVSAAADGSSIIGTVLKKDHDEHAMLYNSLTGELVIDEPLSAKKLLQDAKIKSSSKVHIISLVSNENQLGILSGASNKNEITLNSMGYTKLEEYKPVSSSPLKIAGDVSNASLMASSLKVHSYEEKVYVMGIEKSKLVIANFDSNGKGSGKSIATDMAVTSITVDNENESGMIVRVVGLNGANRVENVFVVGEDDDGGVHCDKISKTDAEALVYCSAMNLVLEASTNKDGSVVLASSGGNIEGDTTLIPTYRGSGTVNNAHLVDCSVDSMTAVFSAKGGMTVVVTLYKNGSSLVAKRLWSTEEALGSVTSALFLDETHAITMNSDGLSNPDDEEENAMQNLQFSQRMQSQLASLKSFLFGGGIFSSLASVALMSDERKAERNYHFGFAKISVMLSESMHRIIALDTAKEGNVVWAMNLNHESSMHKIVHGGQSLSLNHPHGYGGVHDHELMVMSYVPTESSIEWRCFDGMTGRVFSNDVIKVSSGVAQIVPLGSSLHHSSHDSNGCRQVALVIHDDDSVTVVPDTGRSYIIVDEAMSTLGKSGLFVHTIDKASGEFRAMRVSRKAGSSLEPGSKPFELVIVGTALFDPSQEKIVNVAYPQRGEVVQSPSTVLGDDALLLKYLNPHLVVVVTEATKSFLAEISTEAGGDESFYNALSTGDISTSGQKRKPLGASKPGEAPPSAANTVVPSLFVTLIDSVSGEILHRVSHSHVTEADMTDGASTNVPVVISENWVVYTFFNQRTRRTDVGVLTLHEGMIDKNGLTAFSGPEQELIFSSLESAKPIVLSKTFGLAKAISALGVTITKAGISSKQFLFATGNDQVVSMDRRLMDPRRPTGELKPSEKMEGLVK